MGHRQWRREMKAFHKYISVHVYIYIHILRIYVHSKQGTGELVDDKTKSLPLHENVTITLVVIRAQKHLPEMEFDWELQYQ